MKNVIINADDFGQTISCTKAIYDAFEIGLITDTTMVANGDALDLACEYINKNKRFSNHIGCHLVLTEGKPISKSILSNNKFVDNNGYFTNYFLKKTSFFKFLSKKDKSDLFEELNAQII